MQTHGEDIELFPIGMLKKMVEVAIIFNFKAWGLLMKQIEFHGREHR